MNILEPITAHTFPYINGVRTK